MLRAARPLQPLGRSGVGAVESEDRKTASFHLPPGSHPIPVPKGRPAARIAAVLIYGQRQHSQAVRLPLAPGEQSWVQDLTGGGRGEQESDTGGGSLEDRAGHLDRGLLPDPPVLGSPGRHSKSSTGRSRGAFALRLLSATVKPVLGVNPSDVWVCRSGFQVGFCGAPRHSVGTGGDVRGLRCGLSRPIREALTAAINQGSEDVRGGVGGGGLSIQHQKLAPPASPHVVIVPSTLPAQKG